MKTKLSSLLLGLTLSAGLYQAAGQGTAFTYQGRLNDSGSPATGNYDLQFYLRDAPAAGNAVGGTNTLPWVPVTNGLFTVSLDFGAGIFTGSNYWLEIGVRTNGSAAAYGILTPRQALTPVPYAIMANSASNLLGPLPAGQLSGPVSSGNLSGTYGNSVTFNSPGNSFAGNGASLTGVNAATVGGLAAGNFWQTGGNAGTTAGVNYVGTTDNQPLDLKVNNGRALRLEPGGGAGAPNVIGGSAVNFVAPGVAGATISGGGATNYSGYGFTNSIAAALGVIGGGGENTIQVSADYSTISGGEVNTIQTNAQVSDIGGGGFNTIQHDASYATIGGGYLNTVASDRSTVGGGENNTASNIWATVGGGFENLAGDGGASVGGGLANTANGYAATIAGGYGNVATNYCATIGGGYLNTANGYYSAVAGGYVNTAGKYYDTVCGGADNVASGTYSTVAGGDNNTANGEWSFAAGRYAQANHAGSFVWADSTAADFGDTGINQFLIRASGGVVMQTSSLRFPGAGADTSTPVFTHKVTAANVSGNKTYINNPACNGQPNAILIITENWSASDNVGNSKVVGVYYDAGAGQWTIFVDDGTAMPVGVAYNVMVTLP